MLTTFVIGLREGLEASLIVGIIAAFLRRNSSDGADSVGRAGRAVRQMWLGVAAAVGICLAVGVALALLSAALPQRQQEMLECVVAGIAVAMVTYMILWMNAHSRGLKGELETAAASALARGSVLALVAMAFLAVLREGFETAVFLVAAFGNAISPAASAIGVVLGIASATVLGYLIYRGGTKLNLSRFFRITGVVLVLVAGGLVMSTLRAANEAGWLSTGQQPVLDLSWLVRPGSVQASLLSGMLGLQARPVVVEVAAWLVYVAVMLTVVLWPRTRRLSRPAAVRVVLAGGAVAAVTATLLAVLVPAPAPPDGSERILVASGSAEIRNAAGTSAQPVSGDLQVMVRSAPGGALTATISGSVVAGDLDESLDGVVPLQLSSVATVPGVSGAGNYQSAEQSMAPVAAGTLTGAELTASNGGRRPIGLTAADADAALPATAQGNWRVSVVYDTGADVVLDAQLEFTRTLLVTTTAGATVSAGTAAEVRATGTDAARDAQERVAAGAGAAQQRAEIWGEVIPSVLGVAAVLALAFGLGMLGRSRKRAAPPSMSGQPIAPSPATSAPRQPPVVRPAQIGTP